MTEQEELLERAYAAFSAYLAGLEDMTVEEVYAALKDGIEGATRDEILEVALQESARLIQVIKETTQEGLAEIIAQGLEDQLGVEGTARKLRDLIGLNAQQANQALKLEKELEAQGLSPEEIQKRMAQFTKEKIKERAEIIAQTEMRYAVSQGEKQVMANRGAKYKVAISSRDDIVSDVCQKNEAQGPIPIDKPFASGNDTPPFHPRCRCTVSFITSDAQAEREKERADKRAKETAAAKK